MQPRRRIGRRIKLFFACLPTAFAVHAAEKDNPLQTARFPALPEAVANNAVASLKVADTQYVMSFAGLGRGRQIADTHAHTFVLSDKTAAWEKVTSVPGGVGRLAATAASVGELAYVFGGYSVAADGTETSTPWVHSFDPRTSQFIELNPMPVPVDDAVSVTYANRYIYLISGWHDLGNVNLVQQYDTGTNSWAQATPIPGHSLFGHAGGIVAGKMVFCDGVAVHAHPDGPRSFVASNECFVGVIDSSDSRRIDWHPISPHPGLPRYRMAATGIAALNSILFVGGSENPYNYDGIGYDGSPSEPAENALLLNLETLSWKVFAQDNSPSMDHRGLVPFNDGWLSVGGMLRGQEVTDSVVSYSLK